MTLTAAPSLSLLANVVALAEPSASVEDSTSQGQGSPADRLSTYISSSDPQRGAAAEATGAVVGGPGGVPAVLRDAVAVA